METIIVSEQDFEMIIKAIENPPEPNEKLRLAMGEFSKHFVEKNDDTIGQLFKL